MAAASSPGIVSSPYTRALEYRSGALFSAAATTERAANRRFLQPPTTLIHTLRSPPDLCSRRAGLPAYHGYLPSPAFRLWNQQLIIAGPPDCAVLLSSPARCASGIRTHFQVRVKASRQEIQIAFNALPILARAQSRCRFDPDGFPLTSCQSCHCPKTHAPRHHRWYRGAFPWL